MSDKNCHEDDTWAKPLVKLSRGRSAERDTPVFYSISLVAERSGRLNIDQELKEMALRGGRKVGTDVKTLKKRMSKSFKNLSSALDDGKLPKLDLVAGWCDDADLMAELLSEGQEHFPSFQRKCRELLDAVEQGRLVAAKNAVADLNRMRKDCHSRYK